MPNWRKGPSGCSRQDSILENFQEGYFDTEKSCNVMEKFLRIATIDCCWGRGPGKNIFLKSEKFLLKILD
jgi:hypothetical protein